MGQHMRLSYTFTHVLLSTDTALDNSPCSIVYGSHGRECIVAMLPHVHTCTHMYTRARTHTHR